MRHSLLPLTLVAVMAVGLSSCKSKQSVIPAGGQIVAVNEARLAAEKAEAERAAQAAKKAEAERQAYEKMKADQQAREAQLAAREAAVKKAEAEAAAKKAEAERAAADAEAKLLAAQKAAAQAAHDAAGKAEETRAEKFTVVSGQQNVNSNNYHVIVGSFGSKANADNLQSTLRNQGYEASIVRNEAGMYRVIIRSFLTYTEAKPFKDSLRAGTTYPDAWILVQK